MNNNPALSNPASNNSNAHDQKQKKLIRKAISKASFATLATVSSAGLPHVAGVVYEVVEGELWIHTLRTSRKARSISANGSAAVCIPYRRLPVGPPYTVHFQADAQVLDMDSSEAQRLLGVGKLKSISGHGALEMPDGCFVRITPRATVHSFGPGARVMDLIRDPLGSGARSVEQPFSTLDSTAQDAA